MRRDLKRRRRYLIETPQGRNIYSGWVAVFHPRCVGTSLRTALVVGTLLVMINHLQQLAAGNVSPGLALELLLTYAVPYGVSTYGALSACRVDEKGA